MRSFGTGVTDDCVCRELNPDSLAESPLHLIVCHLSSPRRCLVIQKVLEVGQKDSKKKLTKKRGRKEGFVHDGSVLTFRKPQGSKLHPNRKCTQTLRRSKEGSRRMRSCCGGLKEEGSPQQHGRHWTAGKDQKPKASDADQSEVSIE